MYQVTESVPSSGESVTQDDQIVTSLSTEFMNTTMVNQGEDKISNLSNIVAFETSTETSLDNQRSSWWDQDRIHATINQSKG